MLKPFIHYCIQWIIYAEHNLPALVARKRSKQSSLLCKRKAGQSGHEGQSGPLHAIAKPKVKNFIFCA